MNHRTLTLLIKISILKEGDKLACNTLLNARYRMFKESLKPENKDDKEYLWREMNNFSNEIQAICGDQL